ncbi:hypothetical protein FOG51_03037 [Hanseniaspora uvarum]|jgi:casein kinase II subunit beta|uniref:Casein kinase II subunit beta n=1 Tax=Hanseniaspora uvarum TaxID=29833 RepID=A0A1E5RTX6_HANUV|nr:hypothetical protein FOG48_01352 [Hanseniaspora uvarum]KKA03880.1 Casein kinase II subunit beta' [Hanseniaspora uvarum DSM 2768]KAF0271656.1 hypothetical protein FOG51_03037 [Hanseniaspora uvarum]KAF0275252.1 hypothetical protein FOG50_03980 [Hanseniaspora uvarum]OEJ90365.1 Casein kinase II subunit beta' [Hanseniaspora uvarum]
MNNEISDDNSDMIISDSDSNSEESIEDLNWIQTFLEKPGNQIFVEIHMQYLTDRFNLVGLNKYCSEKMSTMLKLMTDDIDFLRGEYSSMSSIEKRMLDKECAKLYGLIHARYILTYQGQYDMMTLYSENIFGKCPRSACTGTPLLPMGLYDVPEQDSFKLYCPCCEDVYRPAHITQGLELFSGFNGSVLSEYKRYQQAFDYPVEKHLTLRDSELPLGKNLDSEGDDLNIINQVLKFNPNIDGAYFGTTFPHFFLMQYPNVVSGEEKPKQRFIPAIYNFDLHYNSQILRYQELKRQQLEEKLSKEYDPKLIKTKSKKIFTSKTKMYT